MGALAHDRLRQEARRMKKKRRINGAFAPRTIEMLESPAWRVLSLSARRILDRGEIEFARHGGKDNGELPVTYVNFEDYGIHHHAIGPALLEVEALGFIAITHGVGGNAEFRKPNLYRLTYRPAKKKRETNEWRKIKSETEAITAKKKRENSRRRKTQKTAAGKRE
jgi:hypothetical protein